MALTEESNRMLDKGHEKAEKVIAVFTRHLEKKVKLLI
jgi:hypothetical protein